MANTDRPFGFRPYTNGMGGTAPRIREYPVLATLATAIYEGDVVYKKTNGVISVADATDTTEVQNIVGVAAHYVATTPGAGATCAVYDDPEQLYVVQVDDNKISTTTILNEVIGQRANLLPTTGNTSTLQSKMELDGSTITSTAQTSTETWDCLQIYGLHPLSVASGSWANVLVKINTNHHIWVGGNAIST